MGETRKTDSSNTYVLLTRIWIFVYDRLVGLWGNLQIRWGFFFLSFLEIGAGGQIFKVVLGDSNVSTMHWTRNILELL